MKTCFSSHWFTFLTIKQLTWLQLILFLSLLFLHLLKEALYFQVLEVNLFSILFCIHFHPLLFLISSFSFFPHISMDILFSFSIHHHYHILIPFLIIFISLSKLLSLFKLISFNIFLYHLLFWSNKSIYLYISFQDL